MKSMKVSEKAIESAVCCPAEPAQPQYPYGLRIELNSETLKLLGIDKLPAVGSKVTFEAKAEVVSVSESEHKEGEPMKNVSLQITDMEIEGSEKEDDTPANRLYQSKSGYERDKKSIIPIEGL